MGIKITRVIKFIRKGDKGNDAVRYWLIPSVSSVTLSDIESGDGTPTPSSVTVRLMKQVGDDSPTTITAPASVGLTISYSLRRAGTLSKAASYTGAVSVPTNTEYTAIEFYLYSGSQMIDTVTVPIVHDGEDGEPGQPGKDGVSYSVILSPNSIAITADGLVVCESDSITAKAYKNVGGVSSEAKDGSMRLYYTKADGTTSNVAATGITVEGVSNYQAVWFEYKVNDKTVASAALVINREGQTGAQGDRGPTLRGPQAWSDCAVGYKFQSGAKGEEWKDVVLYQNNYYSCVKSHAKTASNYPGSTADQTNKYWQLAQQMEIIATKILLTTYALVKNLGVEAIDMKDSKGNILFQAKDGNVTCKTGTFENIKVIGSLRNPFAYVGDSITNDYNDNVVMISNGGGWVDAYSLPWDVGQSGRRVMIVNYKWGSKIADGSGSISAPTGKYFYEDGIAKNSLNFSREAVELMGYGSPTEFYGWIVTKRTDIMTSYRYGKGLKALAFGSVTKTGSLTYKTFDGSKLSISKQSGIKGKYTITMPDNWFAEASHCVVLLTGIGYADDSTTSPVKASLSSRTTTQFVVDVSDDSSPNDGAFEFIIINKNDWI